MKKLLNTLFVTTQGAYLHKEGETVVVKIEDNDSLQLPIHTLDGIVCFGQVSCSPFLMGFCAENNVTITFLTENGRFLAAVKGRTQGNVLLRREQYRMADNPKISADLARWMLLGKLANSRTVLQRALRDHADKISDTEVLAASEKLSYSLRQLETGQGLDVLRGIEGESASLYFSVFDHLITGQKDSFVFDGRNRRPPRDRVNCLLSFLYTLVMHDIRSALETVGLDPYVGFLHRDRPGRPGLALDMMEEFRAFMADRLVLTLINRVQVQPEGFKQSISGAVIMDDETRKQVLIAYQKRKQEEITHPYLKEGMKIGLLYYSQALLFARYVRGDIEGYPVFIWK
ncbi:MAG: type I-C CRISPR-associated endonuclease Cas1c [Candidatus Omnitrophica bacterium]|nr:type I-C CRISPR-associated endonuclease Cas1c [Candidatus Omnitrophota bacterium]MBU4478459.1 type I-C CRISPR-associated endonuclease Cas1c [Candidatus Omnitrophota bacterium]